MDYITMFYNFIFSSGMIEFFGKIYNFFLSVLTQIVSTLQNINSFVLGTINSLSYLNTYTSTGMTKINEIISMMPADLIAIIGRMVWVILLIAVIRIFVG